MFLLSARISSLWAEAGPGAAPWTRSPAARPASRHAICAVRLLLFVMAAACVVTAWLVASALALVWVGLSAPARRNGGSTAD